MEVFLRKKSLEKGGDMHIWKDSMCNIGGVFSKNHPRAMNKEVAVVRYALHLPTSYQDTVSTSDQSVWKSR